MESGAKLQILVLLALTALAEFLLGHLGVILHWFEVPAALAGLVARRESIAAFLANLLVVVAAFALVALLPSLVRRRQGRGRLDEVTVLTALALIGALAVNALARRELALAIANLLMALFCLESVARVLRGTIALPQRLALALVAVAAALPQLWRAAFVLTGGEDSGLAATLRQIAGPVAALAGFALLTFALDAGRRRLVVAAGLGGLLGLGAALAPDSARFLVDDLSGFWFGSWPLPALIALLALGGTALSLCLLDGRRPALALGVFLLACAGCRHRHPAELLTLAIALLLLGHDAAGRPRRLRDLGELLL